MTHQTLFLLLISLASLMVFSVMLLSVGYYAGQVNAYSIARQKINSVFPSSNQPMVSLSGTVAGVDNGVLELDADPVSSNPLDPVAPKRRSVTIDGNTVMRELVFGSDPNGGTTYTQQALVAGDLAVGDRVVVNAADDIRMSGEFVATHVSRTQRVQGAPQ